MIKEIDAVGEVVIILKKRFSNLPTVEVVRIATEIVKALYKE